MLELIRALAIAWKNLAAYPAGHPALAASMALALRRVQELFTASGGVTIGVARDGLVVGQEKVASSHARDLATALYNREVALLRLEPGLDAVELEVLLRHVSLEAVRAEAQPLAQQLAAAGVTHATVESLDFSQLRVTDDVTSAPPPPNLWDDLLNAVLSGHELSAEGREIVDSGQAATPRGLAQILNEVLGGAAYGTAAAAATGTGAGTGTGAPTGERGRLGDRLSQIVGRHFAGASAERILAANEIADLVRAMPPDIRQSIVSAALRALASEESASDALKVLADTVTPDTVLQALRQIKEEVPLSSHALRLLHALSAAAPAATAPRTEAPDPALVKELSVLFLEDDIDRYNPEDHKSLLKQATLEVPTLVSAPIDLGPRMASMTDDVVSDHLAFASVEMLGRLGGRQGTETMLTRIEGHFHDAVARGRLESAVALAEDLREITREHSLRAAVESQVEETIGRLATAESVRAMLDAVGRRGSQAAVLARKLLEVLGAAAAHSFLMALAEEPDKSRRRRLLELVVSFGPAIAGPARERLGDSRWYVVRNMIVILQRVGDLTALPEIRRCANHPDLRVRLEAIKWMLAYDTGVPLELLSKAINDPDPKVAEAAVTLAGSYGIKEAVGPLLAIVSGTDIMRRRESIRVKALKALGDLADPKALPHLVRFFRNQLLPIVSLAERRAAFRSLQTYPADARAPFVARGLRSRDAEIRRTCAALRK